MIASTHSHLRELKRINIPLDSLKLLIIETDGCAEDSSISGQFMN